MKRQKITRAKKREEGQRPPKLSRYARKVMQRVVAEQDVDGEGKPLRSLKELRRVRGQDR